MKILNVDVEFNFNDADDMEKLEKAVNETNIKFKSIEKESKRTSELIRETCKVVFECFNSIFGEGTDKKIFGTKTNLDTCIEAFQDLCNAKDEQEGGLQEKIKAIESKYNPNRALRRQK